MRSNEFGRTGRQVSEIGFGAWAIGASWGHVDEGDAIAALNEALDRGVTFIDRSRTTNRDRTLRIGRQVPAQAWLTGSLNLATGLTSRGCLRRCFCSRSPAS